MLKILFGLISVAVEENTATHVRTKVPAIAFHRTATAEEATTNHAHLQLQVSERLFASRTTMIADLLCLGHISEYSSDSADRRIPNNSSNWQLTWMSNRSYSAPSGGVAQRQSRGLISPVSVVQVYPPPPILPPGTRWVPGGKIGIEDRFHRNQRPLVPPSPFSSRVRRRVGFTAPSGSFTKLWRGTPVPGGCRLGRSTDVHGHKPFKGSEGGASPTLRSHPVQRPATSTPTSPDAGLRRW